MATVTITHATVAATDGKVYASIEPYSDQFAVTLTQGENTTNTIVATYDEAVAVAVAHVDAIDATEIDDKATRYDLESQIKTRDARIAELEALLAERAETAVNA